jgi:hypothetical protein
VVVEGVVAGGPFAAEQQQACAALTQQMGAVPWSRGAFMACGQTAATAATAPPAAPPWCHVSQDRERKRGEAVEGCGVLSRATGRV